MPTIKIEIEVPEDCRNCNYSDLFIGSKTGTCTKFKAKIFRDSDSYNFQRCQECIDAEVKDGSTQTNI